MRPVGGANYFMLNFWQTILIAIISAVTVAVINYFFIIRQKFQELERAQKIKAYGEFLDMARGFLNDPNLDFEQAFEQQKNFIKKFYNEIWVSGSEDVIKTMNKFFETVSITYTNEDDKTRALNNLIIEIRKDLGLKTGDDLKGKYKIYTPNLKALKKEKPE